MKKNGHEHEQHGHREHAPDEHTEHGHQEYQGETHPAHSGEPTPGTSSTGRSEEQARQNIEIAGIVASKLDDRVRAILETEMVAIAQEINARIGALREMIDSSNSVIVLLEGKLRSAETEIARLHGRLVANETGIADLRRTLVTRETEIIAVRNSEKANTNEIADLKVKTAKTETYLNSTLNLPISPPPTRPVIDLLPLPTKDLQGNITVSLIGNGFTPSSAPANPQKVQIVVRWSDTDTQSEKIFETPTSPGGALVDSSFTFQGDPLQAKTYYVAATDGTPNPGDWTGKLWSNSVAFVR